MTNESRVRTNSFSVVPFLTAAFAIAIFIGDTITNLEIAVGTLYVAVVLMAARFCRARTLVLVAAGCVSLSLLSYYLTPHGPAPTAITNTLISIATIVVTTFLILQSQSAEVTLRDQADLLNLTHDAIFVRDMNSVVQYWSRGAEELYGWTAEQATGRVTHELLKTVFPLPLDQIEAEVRGAGRWEGDLVHTKKDGTTVVAASRWSLQRDERGVPIAVLETNNDISERKRADEALRRSESYLAEAQSLTHTGSWAWNVSTREITHWSEECFRLYGFDSKGGLPSWEEWSERVHPDDRDKRRATISHGIRQRTDYELDYRMVLPDGAIRHIHSVAHPIFNPAGELVEFVGTAMDVTERERAEEERQTHLSALESMVHNLRESERKLEQAQRLAHVGYWDRDLDTDLITSSGETYRIYGIPAEKGVLTLDRVRELTHPEDRPMVRQAVSAALQGSRPFNVEYRVVRPNGEVRYVHSQGDVIRDESGRARRIFGTVQDITERKRVEQRLLVQHTVTQILAEAASVEEATPRILESVCESLAWDVGGLWSIDPEAGVLRCVELWHKVSVQVPQFEATTREMTFVPGVGLPGLVWLKREPIYVSDLVRDANFFRTPIAAGEGLHAAFLFPVLLGSEVLGVIEFFSREIRQPDQELLDMMSTIGSQIGQFIERKRAEQALLGAQAQLAHVTRVATLGEMTASIAHEINQPLGAIVNNASACLRWLAAENVEEARNSAKLVIEDGHRAAEIIKRIRSFTKKTPPQKDWIDINQMIREVITLARAEVQRTNVALETRLSDDVHYLPLIFADRIQLQQVILNLMMNAVEAMSEVSDGPRELLLRTSTDGSEAVVVAVQDSGPGLAPENLDRLFTPFYTTKPHGMGMGLAICRSIVEAHGGRLWATVNEDRGATFQFSLPAGSERTA